MTINAEFNQGYRYADVYDDMLPPHYYDGVEDTELAYRFLVDLFGPPDQQVDRYLDVGAGNGRMTKVVAPFARQIVGADRSEGMMADFATKFPYAEALTLDTESLVEFLVGRGDTGGFDLITAFWSLSYPILECFESLDASGVASAGSAVEGVDRAVRMLTGLASLLAPDGTLLGFFFDADTLEQRLVTQLWEQIHPFPGTGRGYTFELLINALRRAENNGLGLFRSTRIPGVAVASNVKHGLQWFTIGHFNSFGPLISDPATETAVTAFLETCERDGPAVLIPSGINVFQFHRPSSRRCLLPA